jgi:general stress protein 26
VSGQDHIERVWDIIEKVEVCMLATQFAGGLRARPIEARPDREAGLIFVVTDVDSAKEDEIEAASDVCLVFIDPNDKAYLSITARADVMRDSAKTMAVWRKSDELWWRGGPTDGPASAAVAAFESAKAWLTGTAPKLGENRKVTVEMRAR